MIHLFVFRWKSGVTGAQQARALAEIRAFQGVIPGLLETHVGMNTSPRGQGYATGGVMKFSSEAAMDEYFVHPAHQALVAWLGPLIEPIEVDFAP